ncbi:MAG: hypothetical protein ACYDCC_04995 [Actinomycetota bacterium]
MRPGISIRKLTVVVLLASASLTPSAKAALAGPVIYTTPVLYATPGQSIGITAEALCDTTVDGCSATIFFRTTQAGSPADLYTLGDPGSGWYSLTMNRDPGVNVQAGTLYSYAVQLPGWIADTRGVDYIIKVNDHGVVSYSPGEPGVASVGLRQGARASAYHVFVTTPSTIVHAPVAESGFNQAITINANATCAYECYAVLFYRRTGLLEPTVLGEGDPGYNPNDASDVQWQAVGMSATKTQFSYTQQYGLTKFDFSGVIPASYVDTRGVDYAIKVVDGPTHAWWPGTVYNGYLDPTDGIRIGWWHVYVLSPVLANHEQMVYRTPPGTPITLNVDALCWTTAPQCAANVRYNSGGPSLTAGMQPIARRELNGLNIITFSVTIPGWEVAYPAFSYSFEVTDGYTHADLPGTPYFGYYVKADGIQAGQFTILVF